jgi:hypothetical protein
MINTRKHTSYDVEQKLNVMDRIHKGETRIKISKELGILA